MVGVGDLERGSGVVQLLLGGGALIEQLLDALMVGLGLVPQRLGPRRLGLEVAVLEPRNQPPAATVCPSANGSSRATALISVTILTFSRASVVPTAWK